MPDKPDKPELKPKPQRKLDRELEKNQITSQAATPQPKSKQRSKNPSATQTPQTKSGEKQTLKIEFADAKNVPLMFQAQIPDRGNIQYVGDDKNNKTQEKDQEKPAYERWVTQWIDGCPSKPEKVDDSEPIWKRKPVQSTIKLPEFGSHVKSWKYQIRWRMVTNGGQDEGLIRPVIGAKGMPFFPGSSMKGAFWRACPEEKRQQYCGGEITVKGKKEKRTKPGILRFHGGYPVDMSWAQCDRLIDIAHGQQPYQVMRNTKEKGANVQISLYQPKFKFGISSTKILEDSEWEEIKLIWEKALASGIGSRVSAGYGYVDRINQDGSVEPIENLDRTLLSIHLNGQGLASQLLLKEDERDKHKTPEFRPNMFKATLRGHTLRLLGGIADEQIAQDLTKKLWGGIPEKGEDKQEQTEDNKPKAIVGSIGIHFTVEGKLCTKGKHTYKQVNKLGNLSTPEMPTYKLENGKLNLLKIGKVKPEAEQFILNLVKFSVLLGGFGKSWRRTHHKRFYPSYFKNNDKPMIGCHWEFAPASEEFYIPANDLSDITEFITNIREDAIAWVKSEIEDYQPNSYVQNWREAWHPNKVQVWGRFAENGNSQAVQWFHETNRLKGSSLAGKMGQIGRTWHRMYPRYVIQDGKLTCLENEYVELLTIFPDESDNKSQQFMDFLSTENSEFKRIW
jgi:CRISPR-associated protein Cmr6